MVATFVNDGRVMLLNAFYNAAGSSFNVHLYTAPTSAPVVSWSLSSMTEATFPGYGLINVGGLSSGIDGNGNSMGSWGAQSWTCLGGGSAEDIYGYYITDSGNSTLLFAEANPNGPVTILNSGDTYSVNLSAFMGQLPGPL